MYFAIDQCLREVFAWMNTFCLSLNKSKTKILVLAPPSIMSSLHIHGTFINSGCISCAKNLGIWLDENLTFKCQINKVVSSCFLMLREISKIKLFVPRECISTLVITLIFPKLDYCNDLYYNNKSLLLQCVQFSAQLILY